MAIKATAGNVSSFSLLNLPGCPQDFYAQSVVIDARNAAAVSQVQFGANQFNINVAPGSYQSYTIPAFVAPNISIVFEDSSDSLFLIFTNYEIPPQNYQASIADLPVAVEYVDASVTSTGASQQLVPLNASRLKLIVGAPFGSIIWVNLAGGVAGPNLASCFSIFPGWPYESMDRVPINAVNVYCQIPGLIIPCTVG